MRFVGFLALASLLYPASQKRNPPKPPDLEVVSAAAHRQDGIIAVDGRVRNSGGRPIEGLTLLFDFMAPRSQVITTKRGVIEEGTLEPGREVEFQVQLDDHARAVQFRIHAEDRDARELRVARNGPFVIE
jgi:hypothetical protein